MLFFFLWGCLLSKRCARQRGRETEREREKEREADSVRERGGVERESTSDNKKRESVSVTLQQPSQPGSLHPGLIHESPNHPAHTKTPRHPPTRSPTQQNRYQP